jgi:hypothetical protein
MEELGKNDEQEQQRIFAFGTFDCGRDHSDYRDDRNTELAAVPSGRQRISSRCEPENDQHIADYVSFVVRW